jgi:hypothetical protein
VTRILALPQRVLCCCAIVTALAAAAGRQFS